jgi:hypothetical protein
MPGAFYAENASSSRIIGTAPQEPPTFNSDPLPNEPAQPGPVRGPTVSPPTFNADRLPNEPAQPGPVRGPTVSPIQTVQTFLTQTIQSNLTAILPGLIQGEVRIQCAQLALEIGSQISSIREEVITGDLDDPMLPSCEEGENEGSRGRGKRSARRSYNKRKGKEVRFATGSDSETDKSDEDDDEGSGIEGDEGINKGSQKYQKKIQALRVSNCSCS